MSINIKRLRVQLKCEEVFNCKDINNWKGISFDRYVHSAIEVELFKNILIDDCIDFYFKGILSISEALSSLKKKLYSWSTIKLYFATYYFVRSAFAANNIIVFKKGKGELYYFENKEGEIPIKCPGRGAQNTHIATFEINKRIFYNSDKLLSNNINDMTSYEWLREKRERVNYRERIFYEPQMADYWEKIAINDLEEQILLYLNDKDFIYCFQNEDGILAIPLKRWELTYLDLKERGILIKLSKEKIDIINNLLNFKPIVFEKLFELYT